MKKVVIISSSMRKGNSDRLCDEFQKGANEAGNQVDRINIRDIKLSFCDGCSDCYNYMRCTKNDDMNKFYPMLLEADVLVFATPIYFGEMSGALKTFFDRMYPLYNHINSKEVYIIASCYDEDHTFVDDSIAGIKRVLSDFGLAEIRKVIYGLEADGPNDVREEALDVAFRVGKGI